MQTLLQCGARTALCKSVRHSFWVSTWKTESVRAIYNKSYVKLMVCRLSYEKYILNPLSKKKNIKRYIAIPRTLMFPLKSIHIISYVCFNLLLPTPPRTKCPRRFLPHAGVWVLKVLAAPAARRWKRPAGALSLHHAHALHSHFAYSYCIFLYLHRIFSSLLALAIMIDMLSRQW